MRSPAMTQYSPATATTPACADTWIGREEYESIDGGWRFARVGSGRSSDGLRSVEVERPKADLEGVPISFSSSDSEPLEDLSRRGGRASPGAIVLFGGGRTLLLVPTAEVSFVEWEQDARTVERRAIELIFVLGDLVSAR